MELDKEQIENKKRYLKIATMGMRVAYYGKNGKAKSGKVVTNDVKQELLEVRDKYAIVDEVKYSDVLWVQSTGRWPKGVYKLLAEAGE